MKLRNKKTGEIDDYIFETIKDRIDLYRRTEHSDTKNIWHYNSLAEMSEDWEDYEEAKPDALSVMILTLTNFIENEPSDNVDLDDCKNMLEKLKAWQRLKVKGFRFDGWTFDDGLRISICTNTDSDGIYDDGKKEMKKDLDLVFGGEE